MLRGHGAPPYALVTGYSISNRQPLLSFPNQPVCLVELCVFYPSFSGFGHPADIYATLTHV